MTIEPPQDLDQLVGYRYPDALWIDYRRHSSKCWTVIVLDLDYRYQVWRGNLSVDHRWTLSPIDVTLDTWERLL